MNRRAKMFLLILLLLAVQAAEAQVMPTGPTSQRDFWLLEFDRLDNSDPLAYRANDIFKKLLAAADKRPGPRPELIVLDEEGYPWARSLTDGAILLSRGAIEICFAAPSEEAGSARLAFILGHELSHHINGDFWHYFFYQGARPERTTDPEAKRTLAEVIEIARRTDSVMTKEMRADQYGALYASMAGYRVADIFGNDTKDNFFARWATATSPGLLSGETGNHPQARNRLAAVRLALERVTDKIEIFDKGMRAYQNRSWVIAKYYFEDFLSVYQSREAYNNLGLVYYRMALEERKIDQGNDGSDRFELTLIIDRQTRAKNSFFNGRLFGLGNQLRPDSRQDRFATYLSTAAGYFEESARRDYTYATALNNHGCVLYLLGEYSAAVGRFDRAITLAPNSAEAYNNRGVAYIKLGTELGANLTAKAKADFEKAIMLDDQNNAARQNLAQISK